MKIKISAIITLLAFAMIGYLMYVKFALEEPVEPKLLIPAALLAVVGSVMRRKGK